jgi:prepilin-type N-terminal cleavage/methylation domain-containing protein
MVEISMKRNKGFSLVELLVSLLVVSIALLGFAALQTFSARTIRTAEHKNVGNEVTQSVVKYLQMSQDSLRGINWSNGDQVLVTCSDIIDVGAAAAADHLGNTLANGLFDLCYSVGNVRGVQGDDLALQFNRNFPGNLTNNEYAYYSVDVRYAYRPLTIKRDPNVVQPSDDDISVGNYCPFDNQNGDNYAKDRKDDNVVCDIVEVNL